jgi:hypothetical protein
MATLAAMLLATTVACGSSGDSKAAFCDGARAAKDAADKQQGLFNGQVSPNPAAVQPAIEDFATKFEAMTKSAPKEIKADVATINAAAQQLLTVVRANGFDVTKMVTTPEFAALTDTFSGTEYQSAQENFQTYIGTNCGITDTTVIGTGPTGT